jgi:hypothetical protein
MAGSVTEFALAQVVPKVRSIGQVINRRMPGVCLGIFGAFKNGMIGERPWRP